MVAGCPITLRLEFSWYSFLLYEWAEKGQFQYDTLYFKGAGGPSFVGVVAHPLAFDCPC
jgi:hypothetical protein